LLEGDGLAGVEAGLLVAGGSDSSITPLNPMLGIYGAKTHTHPFQRLEVYEAVRLFTLNAAAIGFEENVKGSIEAGKYADFAVMSEDPFVAEAEALKEMKVAMTILGGNIVYSKF
ncbi:MAG TPA: amidohydrolase family protein, partial [Synergistaceae bacterium]|nr:amidohydrolase family protein [Synergistaceae bacterium]